MSTINEQTPLEIFASLPSKDKAELLNSLSIEDVETLEHYWPLKARKNQLPPPGDWFYWLIRSGRGGGKTRTGAEWVIERARQYPQYGIALIGQTVFDVRHTMVDFGESSILKISSPNFYPSWNKTDRTLTWPNGAVAITYSGDVPDQLRGPNMMSAWVDELAKFQYPTEIIEQLDMMVRVGPDTRVVITTTPRRIPAIKELLDDEDCVDTVYSTFENRMYLNERTLLRLMKRYKGTRLYRQEILGEYIDEVEGALWSITAINEARFEPDIALPELSKIVVGVDPSATSGESSAETGIIVAARTKERLPMPAKFRLPGTGEQTWHHYITLDDLSLRGTPEQWGRKVILARDKYPGAIIVAEANNGGEMVRTVIQQVDKNARVKLVWAAKGKYRRAEPVAALCEQGRDHHCGVFPELEDQLTTYVPGETSPDRFDAKVWAYKELMGKRGARIA